MTSGRNLKTYLSVKTGRHVALLTEADEGDFDRKRQVRFGAVLRTDDGYMCESRSGSQDALFGCVGVYAKENQTISYTYYIFTIIRETLPSGIHYKST